MTSGCHLGIYEVEETSYRAGEVRTTRSTSHTLESTSEQSVGRCFKAKIAIIVTFKPSLGFIMNYKMV